MGLSLLFDINQHSSAMAHGSPTPLNPPNPPNAPTPCANNVRTSHSLLFSRVRTAINLCLMTKSTRCSKFITQLVDPPQPKLQRLEAVLKLKLCSDLDFPPFILNLHPTLIVTLRPERLTIAWHQVSRTYGHARAQEPQGISPTRISRSA